MSPTLLTLVMMVLLVPCYGQQGANPAGSEIAALSSATALLTTQVDSSIKREPVQPLFKYGDDEMMTLFTEVLPKPDIDRPQLALNKDSITVKFRVLEDGSISDITFEDALGESCAKEVIRVVRITEGLWASSGERSKEWVKLLVPLKVCWHCEKRSNSNGDQIVYPTEGATAARYNDLGLKKAREGKDELAIKLFDEAIRLDTRHANAFFNRGLSKFNTGDFFGACSDWDQAAAMGDRGASHYQSEYCR